MPLTGLQMNEDGTAVVTIAGNTKSVTVKITDGSNVATVLETALRELGVADPDIAKLDAVLNGEMASLDAPVKAGDRVTASNGVANG